MAEMGARLTSLTPFFKVPGGSVGDKEVFVGREFSPATIAGVTNVKLEFVTVVVDGFDIC